ncbi:tRNA lysidine(34) synthetase TilS [Spirulina sp. CCNP1310]|uniref:tRNA lysidine(34) synthetase TilS n=1 Tax=Spirulina sp. CCNP1310 TaxID=3110249 RepID=UPI002B1F1196|nr:tRNA lysidine(34) synthetase TilS [Spirulina sp. CCNP1310]MEA5418446.1 tRNA lysidine(34) synthetase TilS [Spirulina sp. CCNP1310]
MVWSDLHCRIDQAFRQRSLLPPGATLLLAVSGGQDSLCLLKLCVDLQPRWGWRLGVAHCDHRWPSDGGIAAHVAAIAQTYQLPYYQATADNLPQTEAAARAWRYQALTEIAQTEGYGAIATGHTQSDRAETVLYNLIRGAGLTGLATLPWQRPLTDTIQLIRPLLTTTRAETGEFCQRHHLPVWEDALNQNRHYRRNRLRLDIFPQLRQEFNPQVDRAMAQTAELLTSDRDYLEQQTAQLWQASYSPHPPQLARPILAQSHLALQRRVLRQFCQCHLPRAITFAQIEALLPLLTAPQSSQSSTLPGQFILRVEGDWLRLVGSRHG